MQVVVLCGGKATRLGAFAKDRPKYLVPVCGRPFADWQLELLLHQGFTEFVFCIGHLGAPIAAHLDYHWRDLGATYYDEGANQRGKWHAYLHAKHAGLLKERHAVVYGDVYLPVKPEQVRAWFRQQAPVLVTSPTLPSLTLGWEPVDAGLRFLNSSRGRLQQASLPECYPHGVFEVGSPEGIERLQQHLMRRFRYASLP